MALFISKVDSGCEKLKNFLVYLLYYINYQIILAYLV